MIISTLLWMTLCALGTPALASDALRPSAEPAAGLDAGERPDWFSVDWAAFKGNEDSTRVEFSYAIPYDRLNYEAGDTGLVARFSIRFESKGDRGYRQDAVIFKQARLGSFSEARETQRTFVDMFSVSMLPGRYWFRMTVAKPAEVQSDTSGETTDYTEACSVEDSIDVPDFKYGFALSSLQLAAGVVFDTVSGGFSVIPNPTRRYGTPGLDRVYFYYEGYGLDPAQDSYEVRVSMRRPSGSSNEHKTNFAEQTIVKHKSGARVSSALGVSVEGLTAGEYVLAVELYDRGRKESRTQEEVFWVGSPAEAARPTTPYRLQMSELEKQYYRKLSYIATPRELSYYNALSDSGKEAYLAWFWARHNLAEFARRMDTAARKFRTSRTSGIDTDRGRIYVKYGEPDEVERRVLEVDRKPREYWRYYGVGYVFVFIDLTGDDNFRLAYTTSPDEPKTGYENLLTPDEEELFR